MKITYKILFINFAIVFIIIGTAASAFYSIMYNVLTTQQSQILLESTNDFIYAYRENLANLEEDFLYLNKTILKGQLDSPVLEDKNIDFILKVDPQNQKIIAYSSKENIPITEKDLTLQVFFSNNPFNITNLYKDPSGFHYYYGKIITDEVLNKLSKRIRSEIAIIWNNSPSEISNENQNKRFFYSLREAYSELLHKNNFDIYTKNSDNSDLLVTIYKPNTVLNKGNNELHFLIFSSLNAAADLRSSIRDIVLIIGFSGVLISLILTFIFTDKIRKQITDLSKGTELTKEGNFHNRIKVKSNDELGQLASAFNMMLDELEKNQKAKNEYSEFITLLNQNPSLKEVSEASLKKIVLTCGFTVGVLYTVENEIINLASSFGVKRENDFINKELFLSVINSKEPLELNFENNCPIISTGIHTIHLNYLLILPIIYNNKVIALLEFSGVEKPPLDVKEYLSNIQEQLAIGLTNAMAFVQLEKLVTELKQLNEDYQKQNIQIRKQNETLIDLHSKLKEKAEELEIQKQKAEESTKIKSQFLASMSHELRTPMNSILGLSELMLEESAVKGKNRERLEVVLKSGYRLMILINDILDLSKIEAGKMEIRRENVLLDELIKDVEYAVSPLMIAKKIEFEIIKDCNTRIIFNTDRGKVTQVLVNLLGNAIKFTEKGYVQLRVLLENNRNICFEVVDTGIGISEEDLKIIFEEFRQVDGTTTKKFGGTGLGLTICKRIADLLQGNLSVKSTAGIGSVFTFTIPLNFVTEVKEEKNPDLSFHMQKRKKPVLIIDKDCNVRLRIREYLMSKGYEVITAEDGESGLQKAHLHKPFAIALDVLLPPKGSWEVLKDLKNDNDTKDIPVILFSINEGQNTGYGLGAFEYIVKPFSIEQLSNSISRLENLSNKRIEKITIVDDDEFEFEKFKREFNNEKIRIDYIQNPELAFSRILETQPDLLIIDLIMPKLDGISLTYKIKSNKETRHIPVIISTAKDITEEEKKALDDVVESISIKSKGHPHDVLKILRDRIRVQELSSTCENIPIFNDNPELEIANDDEVIRNDYFGEILIIDDDPDTLFTINEILSPLNCKTYLAKGGMEGIKILENINPDIILLDIMMPVMDGFQTIIKIRSNPRLSSIPIYAVTAKAMADDKDIILRNGFNDYIPKPINAGILTSKIKKALTLI